MINLLYTCSCTDVSGYSESSRNYICALNTQKDKINLAVKNVKFEPFKSDHSYYSGIIDPLIGKQITPDVQIIHMTPENFPLHRRSNIKNIGYTTYETALPKKWVTLCNTMDEIWVPSQWNVGVFQESGVKVPVKVVEHTFEMEQYKNIPDLDLEIPKDKFVFYSIFQWTERKNPVGLIRAFLSEFGRNDNVILVLKTYRQNSSIEDQKWIESQIQAVKAGMYIDDHAQVMLIHKNLTRPEILSLHKQGHCLVSPHKAEGWGQVCTDALAVGSPAIATGYSGNTQFMTPDNSYLLDYTMEPCHSMPWPIYSGKGSSVWANPDICQLRSYMREIFNDYKSALAKAEIAKADVEKLNWDSIGSKMASELDRILKR